MEFKRPDAKFRVWGVVCYVMAGFMILGTVLILIGAILALNSSTVRFALNYGGAYAKGYVAGYMIGFGIVVLLVIWAMIHTGILLRRPVKRSGGVYIFYAVVYIIFSIAYLIDTVQAMINANAGQIASGILLLGYAVGSTVFLFLRWSADETGSGPIHGPFPGPSPEPFPGPVPDPVFEPAPGPISEPMPDPLPGPQPQPGIWPANMPDSHTMTVPLPDSVPTPVVEPAGKRMGRVQCVAGDAAGKGFLLPEENMIIVGKDPGKCSLVIHSAYVSTVHCSIRYSASTDMYQVWDHSSNGTFVGSVRVPQTGAQYPAGTVLSLADGANRIRLG